MPYLRVETNVAASKAECIALAKKLTGLLEGVLGKPAQYISVSVIPDMALVFGGTEDPCAQVYLGSIGVLGSEKKNAEVSKAIATALEDLKIPADRYYCYFVVQKPVEVGWSGTTFASFM